MSRQKRISAVEINFFQGRVEFSFKPCRLRIITRSSNRLCNQRSVTLGDFDQLTGYRGDFNPCLPDDPKKAENLLFGRI